LLLIAQVVFLLQHVHRHTVTDATDHLTQALASTCVSNKSLTLGHSKIQKSNKWPHYSDHALWLVIKHDWDTIPINNLINFGGNPIKLLKFEHIYGCRQLPTIPPITKGVSITQPNGHTNVSVMQTMQQLCIKFDVPSFNDFKNI